MLTNLRKKLISALMSAESGIRINTDEIPDALAILDDIVKTNQGRVMAFVWDKARGIQGMQGAQFPVPATSGQAPAALQSQQHRVLGLPEVLALFLTAEPREGVQQLLIVKNFHLAFEKAREDVSSLVQHLIEKGKGEDRKFLIGLMPPGNRLPPEVEPLFLSLTHELPDEEELLHVLSSIVPDDQKGGELLPRTPENDAIVRAALGLTRKQAEGAFAAAMNSPGGVTKEKVWKAKAAIVNQDQILTIEEDPVTFNDVGGLNGIKERLMRTLKDKPVPHPNVRPKGVLCVGLPGCLHPDTPIHDPVANTILTVYERYLTNEPFYVWAADAAGRRVIARADAPYEYPAAEMVTLTLNNGQSLTVTYGHRFWRGASSSDQSWISAAEVCEQLQRYGVYHLPTSEGIYPSVSPQDAEHSTQKAPDWQGGCRDGHRFYGEQPRQAVSNDLELFPSSNDEPQLCYAACGADDQSREHISTRRTSLPRQPRQDYPALVQIGTTCELECRAIAEHDLHETESNRVIQPLVFESTRSGTAQPLALSSQRSTVTDTDYPSKTSPIKDRIFNWRINYGHIAVVKATPAGRGHYYDFHVPALNCYECCGILHHNTGKSYIAKATGNTLGWPTVSVNPGNLMGKYVGDTEQKTRWLFQVLKALAPVIVIMDEVEKTMPKAPKAGKEGDSGVDIRLLGTFLTFMQDVKEKIFWFLTANDATNMDSAFKRRTDRTFYMRLPGPQQRAAIWRIYLQKYFPAEINGEPNPEHLSVLYSVLFDGLKATVRQRVTLNIETWVAKFVPFLLANNREDIAKSLDEISSIVGDKALARTIQDALFDDEHWTPDEIEKCCRLAALESTPIHKIQDEIEHVFESDALAHQALEAWATGKIIDAETGKKYESPVSAKTKEDGPSKRSRKMAGNALT